MTVVLDELVAYLNDLLEVDRFDDYCPNGLQVQGREEVATVVSGVTASQALLEAAVVKGADAVLVHHGYFWKGESPRVVGMRRRRLATLLAHEMSLLAYHLPLDAHPELGNNARLGQLLGIEVWQPLPTAAGDGVGNVGLLPEPVAAAEIVARLARLTGRSPLHIEASPGRVRKVAWCTGAAQGYIEAAVLAGAELFISGEISEPTVHVAREEGIHYVAAGHHATERYGVQALGQHLADRFGLEHCFIDIDNPA